MSLKYPSIPSKILAVSITSAAASFQINNITGWDGVALTSASFGTTAYGVFRNATKTAIEIFEFDPATIASASITITRRGLKFDGDLTTEVAANKLPWTKGDTYVDLGTDTPQLFQDFKNYIDTAIVAGGVPATTTVLGLSKLSTAPVSAPSPIVVGDNDTRVPTQAENDAMAGDATPSSVNKFLVKGKAMVAGATINGATLPVPVYQNKTDNEFYACDANDTAAMKFIGFAISNGTDGATMNVQFSGIVSGFTGLSEGEKYYVQDTAGTIGNTIGTYEILVGIAISETELLIQKGRRRAAGTGNAIGTASGSQVVTTGFRPSLIRLKGSTANSSTSAPSTFMDAVWVNNTYTSLNEADDSSSALVEASASAILYQPGSSASMTFTIGSVTDTGFTITWTETGSFAPTDSAFIWEAEGEL